MTKNYSLNYGSTDSQRLAIINKYYNPASIELLKKAGVTSGMSIAEVGCGHGDMLKAIQSMVHQDGKVYAIDHSNEQLIIAKYTANHPNTEFILQDVFKLKLSQQIDFVYCRLLLMHLSDPIQAIRKMLGLLKPKGKLILEVADVRSLCYEPSPPNINKWLCIPAEDCSQFLLKVAPDSC